MARYIDADLLVKDLKNPDLCNVTDKIISIIKEQPTADVVKIIYSNWIDHYVSTDEDLDGYFDGDYECLECGCVKEETTPYCPMCGARMDGENNEIT